MRKDVESVPYGIRPCPIGMPELSMTSTEISPLLQSALTYNTVPSAGIGADKA